MLHTMRRMVTPISYTHTQTCLHETGLGMQRAHSHTDGAVHSISYIYRLHTRVRGCGLLPIIILTCGGGGVGTLGKLEAIGGVGTREMDRLEVDCTCGRHNT